MKLMTCLGFGGPKAVDVISLTFVSVSTAANVRM